MSFNMTLADLPGEEEKVLWTVFHVLIALLSLSGDSIILVGTSRYKAIKLHRVLIVVIQHLAVSDLLQTVFRVLPIIVSLIGQGWVMGTFLCRVNMTSLYINAPATAMLTAVLSTCKLLIVKNPLKMDTWSRKKAHTICAFFWLFSVLMPTQVMNMFFTTTGSLYFDYIHYCCYSNPFLTSAPIWFIWFQFIFVLIAFLVTVLILISTSVLLLYTAQQAAARRAGTVRWQGILTVTLTTAVFLVSYLPDVIVTTVDILTSVHPSSPVKRTTSFFENINIVANFFVFSLTVRSFREFLSARARHLALKVGLSAPAPPRAVRNVRAQYSEGAQRGEAADPSLLTETTA